MINKINLPEIIIGKNLKNRSGITLIALILTIVVLIILAATSIRVVVGENGIVAKARLVWNVQETEQKKEINKVEYMEEYINDFLPQVTYISDGNDGIVPLPRGFYYVGGDIQTGIVISDKKGDTMDASGTDMGNQFVWIPVSSESDLERTLFDKTGSAVKRFRE